MSVLVKSLSQVRLEKYSMHLNQLLLPLLSVLVKSVSHVRSAEYTLSQ